jgi:hypothetical protein
MLICVRASSSCAKEPPARTSPNGEFVAKAFLEQGQHQVLGIDVRDRSGKVVFAPATRWAVGHNFEYGWDGRGRLWVVSSDVGTAVWQRADDGSWGEADDCDRRSSDIPREILAAMPDHGEVMDRWLAHAREQGHCK